MVNRLFSSWWQITVSGLSYINGQVSSEMVKGLSRRDYIFVEMHEVPGPLSHPEYLIKEQKAVCDERKSRMISGRGQT